MYLLHVHSRRTGERSRKTELRLVDVQNLHEDFENEYLSMFHSNKHQGHIKPQYAGKCRDLPSLVPPPRSQETNPVIEQLYGISSEMSLVVKSLVPGAFSSPIFQNNLGP